VRYRRPAGCGNVKDHAHQAFLRLLRHAEGPLLVLSPALGEIGYLLQPRAGPQAEVTFLRSSGGDGFKVAEHQNTRAPASANYGGLLKPAK
jgi:hypothetical protein